MEVLIVGGNGFVGRHLVQALHSRGDSVRVLALPGEDTSWLDERRIPVFRGDVREPKSLVEPTHGAGVVVNLAAMMDVWRPITDYRAVNVTGALNVGRAALDAGARRIVHMSSSSVYGTGLGPAVDETFPLRPFPDPYPVTKAEGDLAVQRMIADEGLPAVIIRPDQIFGPGDLLHFGSMAARLMAGRSVIVGSGRNAMPFVYVSDLIDALVLAIDHPGAAGQAFNITHDRPLTQLQMLTAIAHAVGAQPPRVRVPYGLLYAAGYAAERIAVVAGKGRRPPITRFGVAFLGLDSRYEIRKARLTLGYSPRVPLLDGVRLTAAWYLAQSRAAGGQARNPEPVGHEA